MNTNKSIDFTTAQLATSMLRKVMGASAPPPPKPAFPRIPNPLIRGNSDFPLFHAENLTWVRMAPRGDDIERFVACDDVYVYIRRMGPRGQWIYSRKQVEDPHASNRTTA